MMRIAIVGAGYVGLVTGACLADLGHEVHIWDTDEAKIEMLNKGEVPIHEPGLEDLIQQYANTPFVSTSDDPPTLFFRHTDEVIGGDFDAFYLAVGTPQDKNGNADLSYLMKAVEWLWANIGPENYPMIIIKSTVPPGTAAKVRALIGPCEKSSIISNPEFLKEGDAIRDFRHPDRIVVGLEARPGIPSDIAANRFFKIYLRATLDNRPYGWAKLNKAQYLWMSNESAELAKYANNGMLATRISFMNEMSRVAHAVGASIDDVRGAVGSDRRIGSSFLAAGPGWGGSCFPKDLAALARMPTAPLPAGYDAGLPLVQSAISTNGIQKDFIHGRVKHILPSPLTIRRIAVWGIAFKPRTDDTRDSPALEIISNLWKDGIEVVAHDPVARLSDEYLKLNAVTQVDDMHQSCAEADLILLLTDWDEYRTADWKLVRQVMRTPKVFDTRNALNYSTASGFVEIIKL